MNLSKKVKNSRNISNNNRLNTDYINTTNNGNNSFLNGTYIKTTMDTNMTKTKIIKEKENISFINDNNTFIYFTPSTNYQSSNVKNTNKRKRIKIPKQKENYFLSKNKPKNINKTYIIPNRLNSLLNIIIFTTSKLTAIPLGNENFHKGGFWEYPDETQ